MKRKHVAIVAVATALGTVSASADQYVARCDTPIESASAALLSSLEISELDRFAFDESYYLVLEAPNEAYVEAYFHSLGRSPSSLLTMKADWTAPAFSTLDIDKRLPLLVEAPCGFCTAR